MDKNIRQNKSMEFLYYINSIQCETFDLDKKIIEIVGTDNFWRKGKIIIFSLIDKSESSLIELTKTKKWYTMHTLLESYKLIWAQNE